jgi:cytochrome c oxidase subunit 3
MSDAQTLLQEPWKELARQSESSKFGIWIFLASEVLFFGALILVYTVYRAYDPAAFVRAARETNVWFGTVNTAVLLTSSLTMALAAQAAAGGNTELRRVVLAGLAATAACGLVFLVLKGFEYKEDLEKHLFPGPSFALPNGVSRIFFALYWILTSVHGIHLTIGIVLVSRLFIAGLVRPLPLACNPQIEVTALYWHLVDVIWIFLYPLIYLPGRAS